MTTPRADIVIAGAGIAGIAAAEALSRRFSHRDILLVDPLPPMSLTSAASGELYRDWWLDERMARWIHGSIARMEAVAAGCGNAFGMNRRGYAFVHTGEDGARRAREEVERFASFGLGPVRVHDGSSGDVYHPSLPRGVAGPDGVDLLLDPALLSRHFPWVTPRAAAIVHARRAGWLDARGFGLRLLELAVERGVRPLRAEVTGFEAGSSGGGGPPAASPDGDGMRAVRLRRPGAPAEERVEARHVVDAAGPFFGELAARAGLRLPVATVLHQLVVMPDPHGVVPRDAPYTILVEPQSLPWSAEERGWVREEGLERLLKPMPGALHLRPEGPLDGTWLRLGWPYHKEPEVPSRAPTLPPEFPDVVLRGAVALAPGLAPYVDAPPRGLSQMGGYYCRTQENLPLVGPSGLPGFWLLGAMSGYGLMAACGAAELLADWMAGHPPPDAEYFSLARYDDSDFIASSSAAASQGEL